MTTIIDYGLGNIGAFINVFNRRNIPLRVASRAEDLEGAERLILPGVGAFDHAMSRLQESGMREPLDTLVLERSVPVLGVCVGMQLLGLTSEEGEMKGLGWIAGHTRRFSRNECGHTLPLPHMGWNDIRPARSPGLFQHLDTDPSFYFLHSFVFCPVAPDDVLATTVYGEEFCCVVGQANVYGVQFHPEKSHHHGESLLRGFAEMSIA